MIAETRNKKFLQRCETNRGIPTLFRSEEKQTDFFRKTSGTKRNNRIVPKNFGSRENLLLQ